MNNFKNLLILTLTALLGLSLFVQPAQSSGPQPYVQPTKFSQTAKAINYDHCLRLATKTFQYVLVFDSAIDQCTKYRP
jgi:hypothetical protein